MESTRVHPNRRCLYMCVYPYIYIKLPCASRRWRQTLEFQLRGGKIDSRGFYTNEHAAAARLRIDVYDAQACRRL